MSDVAMVSLLLLPNRGYLMFVVSRVSQISEFAGELTCSVGR